MRRLLAAVAVILLTSGLVPASAQIEPADLRQLDDLLFQARTAISLLRTGDFRLRGELTVEVDTATKEAAALSSRIGAGEPVDRGVLIGIRERIDAVRRRARGPESVTGMGLGPTAVAPAVSAELEALVVPAGTEATVRLLQSVDLGTLGQGDRVEAVVAEDVRAGSRLIAPAGSLLRGTALGHHGPMGLVFDQILINVTTFRISGTPAGAGWAGVRRAGELIRIRLDPVEGSSARR